MVDTARDASGRGKWSLPVAFGRGLTLFVVVVVLAVGGLATLLLHHQAEDAARNVEADLAMRAARTLETTVRVIESGFAGGAALTSADGTVDRVVFDGFATQLANTTGISTLAYESIVRDVDRVAFEAQIGGPIKQIGPGGLVVASRRDEYLPIRWTHPQIDTSAMLLGFDVSADPVRAATADIARDLGTVAFSQTIMIQPQSELGFFLIKALYRPGVRLTSTSERRAALVGFVSAAVRGSQLLDDVLAQLPNAAHVRVTDTDLTLAVTPSAPRGGHRAFVSGGGRPWVITVDERSVDHGRAALMGAGTLAVAALVGLFLSRNRRQTRELRTAALGVQLLGQLSEQLGTAENIGDIARTVARHSAGAVGASAAVIVVPGEQGLEPAGAAAQQPLAAAASLVDAWTTATPIYLGDHRQMRRRYPGDVADFIRRGAGSSVSIPLRRAPGDVIGVLGMEWTTRQRFRSQLRDTLEATAELCQQSLLRVRVQEVRRATAAALSELGQRLSAVRTLTELANEVVRLAPRASGADFVGVGFIDEPTSRVRLMRSAALPGDGGKREFDLIPFDPRSDFFALLRRGSRVRFNTGADIDRYPALRELVGPHISRLICLPLIDSAGHLGGLVAFVYTAAASISDDPGRLMTIADLTALTLERAELFQRQSELVVELQRRTLPELPTIEGLRLAARYLPSSTALGLGGDWYDVQSLGEGLVGLVVGDVVGHGIEAIADMTEIRTTVSTLMRINPDLSTLATTSTSLLEADGHGDVLFATAALMIIDVIRGALHYVRAGHPPPLVLLPSGDVVVLDGAGTTPIGVPGEAARTASSELPGGSVIVGYTDGLIERRGENIDDGIARLSAALATCAAAGNTDPDLVADALLAACVGGRTTEDDAALLVVRID